MFHVINPYFTTIAQNAYRVSTASLNDTINLKKAVQQVMDNERIFLLKMNSIVAQYDIEAKEKVVALRKIEVILLVATLAILFIEGIFIFRPVVNRLGVAVEKLITSEKSASHLATELQITNEKLKESFAREQLTKTASLIEGQETERKNISMELHDGLIQTLASLKRGLEVLHENGDDNTKKQISTIVTIANDSIGEARRISNNLMPSALYDLGLACNQTPCKSHIRDNWY